MACVCILSVTGVLFGVGGMGVGKKGDELGYFVKIQGNGETKERTTNDNWVLCP